MPVLPVDASKFAGMSEEQQRTFPRRVVIGEHLTPDELARMPKMIARMPRMMPRNGTTMPTIPSTRAAVACRVSLGAHAPGQRDGHDGFALRASALLAGVVVCHLHLLPARMTSKLDHVGPFANGGSCC